MFIIGNLFIAVAEILNVVLTIMYWLILIRALLSWVNPDPFNPIVQFLYKATDPILAIIRRFVPMRGIDFSSIIAFLLIIFLKRFLIQTLMDIGLDLRVS